MESFQATVNENLLYSVPPTYLMEMEKEPFNDDLVKQIMLLTTSRDSQPGHFPQQHEKPTQNISRANASKASTTLCGKIYRCPKIGSRSTTRPA